MPTSQGTRLADRLGLVTAVERDRDHPAGRASAGIWPLALLLATANALGYADRFLFTAAAPLVQAHFALSDGWVGLLLGPAFAVPYGIGAIVLGWFSDRQPTRRLVLGGIVGWTLGSLMVAACATLGQLVAARIVLGIGQAAFMPAALALLLAHAPVARRASVLSIFTTGSALGRSAGMLVAGGVLAMLAVLGIAATTGWRWLFVVTAAPNILVVITAASIDLGPEDQRPRPERGRWRGMDPVALAILLAGSIAPILIGQGFAAWLPAILVRGHGLSVAAAASLAGGLTLVAAPLGQLAGGVVMSRVPGAARRPAATMTLALAAALMPLALTCGTSSLILLGVGVVAFNLLAGIASFTILFALQAMIPIDRRGSINGLFLAAVTLFGSGLGPFVIGIISQHASSLGATGLERALIAVGIGAVGLALMAALLNRDRYARAVRSIDGMQPA